MTNLLDAAAEFSTEEPGIWTATPEPRDKPHDDSFIHLCVAMNKAAHDDAPTIGARLQSFIEFFNGSGRFWTSVAMSPRDKCDEVRGLRWLWRLVTTPTRVAVAEDWWGQVVDVDADELTFTARLVPADDDGPGGERLVDFDLDDVAAEARKLVTVGATFRWLAYYTETPSGRAYQSMLRFDDDRNGLEPSDENREFARKLAVAFKHGGTRTTGS